MLFMKKTHILYALSQGIVVEEKEVLYGESAEPSIIPSKEGYDFTRWDKDITFIKENTDFNAIFTQKEYDVVFKDHDDKVLLATKVKHGENATAPNDPERENYIFTGWDKTFDNITSDMVIKALYEEDPHRIIFETYINKSILKWRPVEGVSRYYIQIGEAKTMSAKPEVDLGYNGIGHISSHTKVIVTDESNTYKGIIYLNRLGSESYTISTKEVPLLKTLTGFQIVEAKFLTFPRVVNDSPSWSTPKYVLYYNDQYSAIQTPISQGDEKVFFNLGGLTWTFQPQIIKIVLIGHGEYGNAISASIHIDKNADGSFKIIKVE